MFKPNNKASKGRPAGSPNKATSDIRKFYKTLLESNTEKMQDDLNTLEPKDRLKMLLELSKFVLPTLKSTEVSATIEDSNSLANRIYNLTDTEVERL